MREYEHLIETRNENIWDHRPWYWQKSCKGAWNGPKGDWVESHYQAIRKLVPGRGTVIQAGGNQGMYAHFLSTMFERVYTFEPDPVNFHCLTLNTQRDNVFKFQAALGEVGGLIPFDNTNKINTGMHKVDTKGKFKVPVMSIDSLGLDSCDYIMLDIEGYEVHALMGAFNTLDRFKPVVSCECGDEVIENFLGLLGYRNIHTSRHDTFYRFQES